MARGVVRLVNLNPPTADPATCRHDVCVVLTGELAICEGCGDVVVTDEVLQQIHQARARLFPRPNRGN